MLSRQRNYIFLFQVNNFENDDWGDEFHEFDEIFEKSPGGDPFSK